MTTPNPGSKAAKVKGCTCSVAKNHGGAGEPINDGKNRRHYIALYCPVHSDFKPLPPT